MFKSSVHQPALPIPLLLPFYLEYTEKSRRKKKREEVENIERIVSLQNFLTVW